jgi:lysyl-tRNA synthetase class 2
MTVDLRRRRLREIGDAYEREVRRVDQEPRLVGALAFILTFLVARVVTHTLLESRGGGGLEIGGLHIHHVVFGIALLLLGALLDFTDALRRTRAMIFGVGGALVLDEFALVLNLADVYWLPAGRESIDAVIIFGSLLVLVVVGGGFWRAVWRVVTRRL